MATASPASTVHTGAAAREESKGPEAPRWIYGGSRVVEGWALPSAASPNELKRSVEEKLAEIKQWTVDDKVFMAQSGLTKLKEHLSSIQSDSEEVKGLVSGLLDQCTTSELAKDTARRAQSCTKLLNEFYNHEGWSQSHDSDGIQTYYRAEPGTGTHSFKLSGTIPAPLLQLAACIYEVDLFYNWFPMLKSSAELANPSRFRKVVHMEVSVPWPVWNRDVVADCFGVDLMEEQKVLINVQSIDEFPQLVIPGPRDGVVRCKITLGGFLIEPLSKSESRFQMIMNADPQLPVLPYALLNWFTSKVIHYIIVKLRTAANFPPTHEYQKRIDGNPAMYKYLKGVIDAFFPDQSASSS